jgi:hypothetical protein
MQNVLILDTDRVGLLEQASFIKPVEIRSVERTCIKYNLPSYLLNKFYRAILFTYTSDPFKFHNFRVSHMAEAPGSGYGHQALIKIS